jgi:hypothetical protein
VKNAVLTQCTFSCTATVTLCLRIAGKQMDLARPKTQKQRWESYKNGRERPHCLGFQPPKQFFGVAPALRHLFGADSFPTAAEEARKANSRR